MHIIRIERCSTCSFKGVSTTCINICMSQLDICVSVTYVCVNRSPSHSTKKNVNSGLGHGHACFGQQPRDLVTLLDSLIDSSSTEVNRRT